MDDYLIAAVISILLCNCLILAWVTLLTVALMFGGRSSKKAAERRQAIIDEYEIAQQERKLAGGVDSNER